MTEKFFDFDKYMEEKSGTETPFVVKAFGKNYEIPNEVPFDIILKVKRMHQNGTDEVDEESMVDMCKSIFGAQAFAEWLEKGISLDGILVLTENVMARYMDSATNTAQRTADEKLKSMPKP